MLKNGSILEPKIRPVWFQTKIPRQPLQFVTGSLSLQSPLGKNKENRLKTMKKDIHPDYREVVFYDTSSEHKFLTRSTLKSKETIKWEDGKEYPLVKVEVSSASHPFFTGKKLFVDTAGRVEKFQKKYQKKS
jgi:large subunit ribosomal protein L31